MSVTLNLIQNTDSIQEVQKSTVRYTSHHDVVIRSNSDPIKKVQNKSNKIIGNPRDKGMITHEQFSKLPY